MRWAREARVGVSVADGCLVSKTIRTDTQERWGMKWPGWPAPATLLIVLVAAKQLNQCSGSDILQSNEIKGKSEVPPEGWSSYHSGLRHGNWHSLQRACLSPHSVASQKLTLQAAKGTLPHPCHLASPMTGQMWPLANSKGSSLWDCEPNMQGSPSQVAYVQTVVLSELLLLERI